MFKDGNIVLNCDNYSDINVKLTNLIQMLFLPCRLKVFQLPLKSLELFVQVSVYLTEIIIAIFVIQ